MLVWVASFPRSGNTFLRIVLHRRYGLRTSTVYDVDGVARRVGPDLIGFTERPDTIAGMRADDAVHFVKTHRQRGADVDPADPAICLVRDGRDALVSWARQATEDDPDRFTAELRTRITRTAGPGTGGWGTNVLSWRQPPAPHRVLLHYDELVATPEAAADRALAVVAPALRPLPDARLPTFAELHAADGGFFRRGITGSHRDELPDDLHELFWSQPGNAAAMALLGLPR